MDVVRIIARLNIGGPALHVLNVSAGLADRYSTLLVVGEVDSGEAEVDIEVLAPGVEVYRIPELGRKIHLWDDLVAFVKLVRLLRRTRPTIVHTHTAKAGTLGRLAAVAAGAPVRVHTFHGHVFRGYFGRWTTRVFLLVERILARVSTRIVAISESQADELAEQFRICDRDRLEVIPLGLELDRFHPTSSAPLRPEFRAEIGVGDDPVVTIVGRLAPIKNHDLFLEAAARLRTSGRRVVFLVVGGGTEEARLKERARDLDVGDCVYFLGWRSDLDRIYAGSDLVVLTSNNEGTPVSLIEALAAGRAVVATDVGGVRDVLENGRLGILVPPGDASALAEAIAGLLDQPELRRELGSLGAAAAPRRFGAGRLVRDIAGLYDLLTTAAAANRLEFSTPTSVKR